MTVDPLRFSEKYDPPPRDLPSPTDYMDDDQFDAAYDAWLDTLDHHTVGECDCERCQCGEDVAA